MKVLGKILILILLFISCKRVNEQKAKDVISISQSTTDTIDNINNISKEKKISIDDFFKIAIDIISKGDENEIKSIILFPFEGYTLGGEKISYSDFESLTMSSEVYESFTNLKYAINIESGKDKEMYWIDIKNPNGYETSNLYRINKLEDKFKFSGMQLPF
ncbi:MAG: hypothetical protein L3J08_09015 [Flavobacteriaceae bacterium]|nr:hypothetical protein [Flavobacteriaceae bacterium]